MTDRRISSRLAGFALIALFLGASLAPATAHAMELVGSPDTTETTEPDTTEPGTTEPGTTEPESSEPESSEPDTTGEEDESDDPTVAIIAVIAFVGLIGVASWWMVRRNDDDDAPHPRRPNPDEPLPGQDLF